MQIEYTENGTRYKWYLASSDGASFIVYRDDKTDKEVKEAIREIRNERDVVSLRIANFQDLVDDFWSYVFRYAEDTYFLNWTQIDKDIPELSNCVRKGISYKDYVDSKQKIWKQTKISN